MPFSFSPAVASTATTWLPMRMKIIRKKGTRKPKSPPARSLGGEASTTSTPKGVRTSRHAEPLEGLGHLGLLQGLQGPPHLLHDHLAFREARGQAAVDPVDALPKDHPRGVAAFPHRPFRVRIVHGLNPRGLQGLPRLLGKARYRHLLGLGRRFLHEPTHEEGGREHKEGHKQDGKEQGGEDQLPVAENL